MIQIFCSQCTTKLAYGEWLSYNANPATYASHPWGEGGHLDLLWFPVTQMWVGIRPCPRLYQTLFARYLLHFFADGCQILIYMVTMDKTLNWLTFCDHGSIFNVTGVIMFQN